MEGILKVLFEIDVWAILALALVWLSILFFKYVIFRIMLDLTEKYNLGGLKKAYKIFSNGGAGCLIDAMEIKDGRLDFKSGYSTEELVVVKK